MIMPAKSPIMNRRSPMPNSSPREKDWTEDAVDVFVGVTV